MTTTSGAPYFRGWVVNSIDCTEQGLFLQVWNGARTSMTRMSVVEATQAAELLDNTAAGDELRDALQIAQRWLLTRPKAGRP